MEQIRILIWFCWVYKILQLRREKVKFYKKLQELFSSEVVALFYDLAIAILGI